MVRVAGAMCVCIALALCAGCSGKQMIAYGTGDIAISGTEGLKTVTLSVDTFDDARKTVAGNDLLFTSGKVVFVGDDIYCINAEKHYYDGTVAAQITAAVASHLKKRGAFRDVLANAVPQSDYVLKGSIRQFSGRQDYSHEAAFLSHFGPLAFLMASRHRSPAIIHIELTDLRIIDTKGNIAKHLGTIVKTYEEDLPVDRYCTSIYGNVNEKLKDVTGILAVQVEKAILEKKAGDTR